METEFRLFVTKVAMDIVADGCCVLSTFPLAADQTCELLIPCKHIVVFGPNMHPTIRSTQLVRFR